MYALALIAATLGLATASPISSLLSARQAPPNFVASVDRWTGSNCSGTVCNVAGSGDLHPGCNPITDRCQGSLSLNYANLGCTGMFFFFLFFLIKTMIKCISSSFHLLRLTSIVCFCLAVTVFADEKCQNKGPIALQTAGVCSALATPFKSIYVKC
jgi:hypothetical protein